MPEPRDEFANVYDLFHDGEWRYGEAEFRERLARALHDITCSCADPDDEEPYLYEPTPGEFNLYQRRADDLLRLVAEQRPLAYGPVPTPGSDGRDDG